MFFFWQKLMVRWQMMAVDVQPTDYVSAGLNILYHTYQHKQQLARDLFIYF